MRCTPRNQLVLSSQHGSLAIRASFAGEREAGLPLTICAQAHERLPARRPGSARPPPPGMGMGPPVPGMMPPGRGVLMRPTLPGMPPRMPGMQPPGRGAMPGLGMPTPRGVPAQPGPVRGAAMPAGVLPRPLPGGGSPDGGCCTGRGVPADARAGTALAVSRWGARDADARRPDAPCTARPRARSAADTRGWDARVSDDDGSQPGALSPGATRAPQSAVSLVATCGRMMRGS